jgi:hypothetical protein
MLADHRDMLSDTPLWRLDLVEPEAQGTGKQGSVGSRFVMETFHADLQASRPSIIHLSASNTSTMVFLREVQQEASTPDDMVSLIHANPRRSWPRRSSSWDCVAPHGPGASRRAQMHLSSQRSGPGSPRSHRTILFAMSLTSSLLPLGRFSKFDPATALDGFQNHIRLGAAH